MSNVTNVILCTALTDEFHQTVKQVEKLMPAQHGPFTLVESVDSEKQLECAVYVAAFNHIDVTMLVTLLEMVEWQRPESVQLFVKQDGELGFSEIPLTLQEVPNLIGRIRMPRLPRGLNADGTPRK